MPYTVAYGLAGLGIPFAGALLVSVAREQPNLPKLAHIGSHAVAVTLAILSPVWGGIAWGSITGSSTTSSPHACSSAATGTLTRALGPR